VLEKLASLDYTFDSIMAATVALSFFKSFKFLQVRGGWQWLRGSGTGG
jgi:hypothetical protein